MSASEVLEAQKAYEERRRQGMDPELAKKLKAGLEQAVQETQPVDYVRMKPEERVDFFGLTHGEVAACAWKDKMRYP